MRNPPQPDSVDQSPPAKRANAGNAPRFDVFLSHASEDKDEFVRPLASVLAGMGLRVWFDEWTLKLGDSLRQTIDAGLAASDYGVVVLSRNFFAKNWPQAELDGLVAREMQGRKVVLPVWHEVTKDEVIKYSPLLAGKLATITDHGVEAVAAEIFAVVRPEAPAPPVQSPVARRAGHRKNQAAQFNTTLNEQLRWFVRLAPLLYKLGEAIEGQDSHRFLSAMQRFFHGRDLLTQAIDADLLTATDNLLRVLCAAGDLPYQLGKLATAVHHLETYRNRIGFGFQLGPLVGGQEPWREIGFLHGTMSNLLDTGPELPECDLLILRLNTALLEYGQSQQNTRKPYPAFGLSLHGALRKYLDYAVDQHLNTALPDPLDTIGNSDMKGYCRATWEHCEHSALKHPAPPLRRKAQRPSQPSGLSARSAAESAREKRRRRERQGVPGPAGARCPEAGAARSAVRQGCLARRASLFSERRSHRGRRQEVPRVKVGLWRVQ